MMFSYGQNEDKIENILFDCLINSYNDVHVDLNNDLNDFEKYLVEIGTLKSTTGQSYYDFYKQVVELNDIPGEIDADRFNNFYKLQPYEFYSIVCLQGLMKINSMEIENSKYFQMTMKMQEISSTRDISPSTVANAIITVLTPYDFDKPYYRAIALLTLAYTSNIETGLVRTLNPVETIDYSEFPSISILVNEKNEISYNDIIEDFEKFKNDLYCFIKQNRSNHMVVLSCKKETTYGFYLKVQGGIFEVYSRLREEKSIELFKKTFAELTEKEKNEIVKVYPTNIKEK